MMRKIQIGDKFNMLVCKSESYATLNKNGKKIWVSLFKCECGTEKDIETKFVKSGNTKSCGCLAKKSASERAIKRNTKYLDKINKHKLYSSYKTMKSRCYCKEDIRYFGDEIKVCDEWKDSYQNFYDWAIDKWSDGMCLSRIDETKDYSPENCYFRSRKDVSLDGVKICNDAMRNKTDEEIAEINKKRKEFYINEYGDGVTHQMHIPSVKQQVRDTTKENWGDEHFLRTEAGQKIVGDNNEAKYGVRNVFQVPEFQQKSMETKLARYSHPFYGKSYLGVENTIRKFLESESNKKFPSNWTILTRKEIDMYCDELKIGIEYSSLYFHTEDKKKGEDYHYNKYKDCEDAGVRLITIFGDEWNNRQFQVKSFLKSCIGVYKTKVFARKCTVCKIDKNVGKDFIEKYHIQGQKRCTGVYFGIFYDGQLLGVLSLGRHHRDTNKPPVLNRLAFKDGFLVVGGASKLLKIAIRWAKTKGYSKITSWSDNRWSQGNVYQKLGFTMTEEVPYDYSYVHKSSQTDRVSKQKCQKKFIDCKIGQTEKERMTELGYVRIWDCGKKQWAIEF